MNRTLASLLIITAFSFVGKVVLAEVNSVTPSTNDINRTNGWAHVDQVSVGAGEVTLNFIQPRSFFACFEYRTDGDTSQASGANFNTLVTDGLYPYYCQNNNSSTHTINANQYVEIRMVFGAEEDERFDWTRFDVLFERSAEITSPVNGSTVSGVVSFDATLNDKDGDDSVQWAVRQGTCAAGIGTVLGNVDGFSDAFTWDSKDFHASADTSTWTPGNYCFVFNPSESTGDSVIRETSEFTISDITPPTVPTNLHWVNRAEEVVACGSTITDLVAGAVKADWDDSTDNVGVDHYEYVSFNPPNGWAWPSLDTGYVVTNSEYGDTNYTPSLGLYGFMVRAVDVAGNKSEWTDISKTIGDSCQINFSEQPALVGPPTDKDQCKNDGWMSFNNPSFKNQGDCVSYVQSSEKAKGNKNK